MNISLSGSYIKKMLCRKLYCFTLVFRFQEIVDMFRDTLYIELTVLFLYSSSFISNIITIIIPAFTSRFVHPIFPSELPKYLQKLLLLQKESSYCNKIRHSNSPLVAVITLLDGVQSNKLVPVARGRSGSFYFIISGVHSAIFNPLDTGC